MPIYEYRCDACGSTFEVFQKFSDAPLETCEVCGGQLRKVLHPVAVHFKGSGFYTTDYARSKSFRASAKEAQGDGKESVSGSESVTADTSAKSAAAGNGKGAEAAKKKPAS